MSEEQNVRTLPFQGTVHGVISHLVDKKDDIGEIYAIVKRKDGSSYECVVGDLGGLSFAILQLQLFGMQALEAQ